jgi:tetracycline repressor-like protein
MARTIPPDRLAHLVHCATDVFIAQGYQRTQMADIAAALGVAKGTLYLYVESKDALFDLVLRCADAERPFAHLGPAGAFEQKPTVSGVVLGSEPKLSGRNLRCSPR